MITHYSNEIQAHNLAVFFPTLEETLGCHQELLAEGLKHFGGSVNGKVQHTDYWVRLSLKIYQRLTDEKVMPELLLASTTLEALSLPARSCPAYFNDPRYKIESVIRGHKNKGRFNISIRFVFGSHEVRDRYPLL